MWNACVGCDSANQVGLQARSGPVTSAPFVHAEHAPMLSSSHSDWQQQNPTQGFVEWITVHEKAHMSQEDSVVAYLLLRRIAVGRAHRT